MVPKRISPLWALWLSLLMAIPLSGQTPEPGTDSLVSENWFITGEDFSLSEQPFGIALRFFGQNLAVDLGAIIIGEIIKEGFPIPWLSFVYHFGG